MTARGSYTGTTAYKRAREALRRVSLRNNAPCCFCGGEIDYTDKSRGPWSFSADHAIPVSKGGPLVGPNVLRPSHLRCNTAAGNRWGTEEDGARPEVREVTMYATADDLIRRIQTES